MKKCWIAFAWILLSTLASNSVEAQIQKLEWPKVTNQTKPWARWWWLGNVGEPREFTVEMEKYAKAGIGGLEITPIYGVKGYESKFVNYLSPQWMKLLAHTLSEGERLGLGIDMATGTGWPFGGPWVGDEDACKNFVTKTWKLSNGERLTAPVTYLEKPLVRVIGKRLQISDIKFPLTANENMQALAFEQVRYERPLPLHLLMAYGPNGQTLELTKLVNAQGELSWQAPAGDWTLYALFQGWHGKMVERAGPGGEGNVIDHFSRPALQHYLDKFDEAFKGQDLHALRGFFNDSYEVDDALGEADFTPRLFEEFQRRRGYDLRQHLPALLGEVNAEYSLRVLCDYRETISELLLDEFTKPWHEWAAKKGKITRNQSHGSLANILDLYATNDIPETEGQEILRMKFASSAAHVTGKQLVSAEAATWLNDHTLATLGDVKTAVDNFFLGGVNHIVYHGIPFSPETEQWPGLLFYAAVHFGPSNPYWQDFGALNLYVTRVQSFLQSGKADNELLLYYPIHDSWSEKGRERLQHYGGGIESGLGINTGKSLIDSGYGWDMISDKQLANAQSAYGQIQTAGSKYKAIVIPTLKSMPIATWQKLLSLAERGATVIFEGALPKDVPGWFQYTDRQKQLAGSQSKLAFNAANPKQARVGKGSVVISQNLADTLASHGIAAETLSQFGLSYLRTQQPAGENYFIVNRTEQPIQGWIPFRLSGKSVALFDAYTGAKGSALSRHKTEGIQEVFIQLQPGASMIVQSYKQELRTEAFAFYQPNKASESLSGNWKIEFLSGGPALPASLNLNALQSWTTLGRNGDESFSGTARYSLSFAKPVSIASAYRFDLGKVAESARVKLNGTALGTLIKAPFQFVAPATLLREHNVLEVEVTNLMTNRVIELERKGVNWKRFYNVNLAAKRKENLDKNNVFTALHWQPRPSGLLGPVTITPIRLLQPNSKGTSEETAPGDK